MLGALCVLSLIFLQGRQVLFRLVLPTRGGKVQEPALHLVSRTPDSQSSSCFSYSHECSLCKLGKVSQTFTLLFGFSFADNKKQWTISLYNGLLPANWTVFFPQRQKSASSSRMDQRVNHHYPCFLGLSEENREA